MTTRLCCAYLRIYRPLGALSEEEQTFVLRSRSNGEPARAGSGRHALGLLAPDEMKEVYERTIDGTTYVCLGHTRLRKLLALVAFDRSVADPSLFFSREEVSRARAELDTLQRLQPDVQPSIVQSVWHVPPRWFACFDESERRIEQSGDHPTIRYETRVEAARERVGSALQTLAGGIVHPVIVGMIYELREWIASFPDDALLELDYASVSTLFDSDELADDHSAADVWKAIRALGEGDGLAAAIFYRRVNERWANVRGRETLN